MIGTDVGAPAGYTIIPMQWSGPDCGYLSSYVRDICNSCFDQNTLNYCRGGYAAGQLFDTDNYNVIVEAQDC